MRMGRVSSRLARIGILPGQGIWVKEEERRFGSLCLKGAPSYPFWSGRYLTGLPGEVARHDGNVCRKAAGV